MKPTTIFSGLLVLAVLASAGCSRREEPIGPAQQAGKAIDDAGAKVAEKMHEQVEKADQAAKAMRDHADEAREKIKDATADASRGLDKATEQVGKKVEQAGEKIQQATK
jgi:L-lactate utilization protein LutB